MTKKDERVLVRETFRQEIAEKYADPRMQEYAMVMYALGSAARHIKPLFEVLAGLAVLISQEVYPDIGEEGIIQLNKDITEAIGKKGG